MKRHSKLVPMSHDHHHALARARRLRSAAAEGDPAAMEAAAASFIEFFEHDAVRHFRQEEEILFPLLVHALGASPPIVTDLLEEHGRMHALVATLGHEVQQQALSRLTLDGTGRLLQAHVRREERELFPLIERAVPPYALSNLALERGAAGRPEHGGPNGSTGGTVHRLQPR